MKRTAALIVALCLATFSGGCSVTGSDFDKLYVAKQAFQTSQAAFEAALDANLFKTQAEARPVQFASDAVFEVLRDAEAKLKAGDKIGFAFAMNSFQTVLGKFRQYLLRNQVPDPKPQARGDLWDSSNSSSSSSAFSNPRWTKRPGGALCSPKPGVASRSPMKIMPKWMPRSLGSAGA